MGRSFPAVVDGHVLLRNTTCMRPRPCRACGYVEDPEELHGRRLYELDRRILLGAAPAGDPDGEIVVPTTPANSDRVMLRRSIRKLQGYGLLDYRNAYLKPGRKPETQLEMLQQKEAGWPRLVRRTPFGDEIVRLYERELNLPSMRIRWDDRLRVAIAAAADRCAHGRNGE